MGVDASSATLVYWQTGPPVRCFSTLRPDALSEHPLQTLRLTRGEHQVPDQAEPTNEKARQRNVAVKSALKTAVRRVRTAAGPGTPRPRRPRCRSPPRQLDKAASKGVIHKNQAANRKSGLAKQVAGL